MSAPGILRVALLVSVLPVLGMFGSHQWVLDLFNHFQAQYFCLILLAAVILAVWRKWRHFMVAALLLAVPGARLAPLYWPADAAASSPRLRVATFNVLGTNARHADVVAWIQRANPDFIYLSETNEKWGVGLAPLAASHPHAVDLFIQGNFGFSFRSKHPIVRKKMHHLGMLELPLLEAVVATPNGEITVFGAHPVPPVTRFWAAERDTYLRQMAEQSKTVAGRLTVLGDLNATRWSQSLTGLFDQGLRDSAEGHGFSATWMRGNPLMAIPIDHILTRGFHGTLRRETGPDLGSDHRPVVADLAW
jgi:endonuclease/exonuclease/phosphatase (EEP) superfamily protein YafD